MKAKDRSGYWDISFYPYGGDFKRIKETDEFEIISEKEVKYVGREVKIRFSDKRIGIIDKSFILIDEKSK